MASAFSLPTLHLSPKSSVVYGRWDNRKPRGQKSMSTDEPNNTHAPNTFADALLALKALQTPPPEQVNKHIMSIIVAVALAIGAYVVYGVSDMQNAMSSIKVTVDSSSKTLDAMQRDIRTQAENQSDMKATQAQLTQRVDALERTNGLK